MKKTNVEIYPRSSKNAQVDESRIPKGGVTCSYAMKN